MWRDYYLCNYSIFKTHYGGVFIMQKKQYWNVKTIGVHGSSDRHASGTHTSSGH